MAKRQVSIKNESKKDWVVGIDDNVTTYPGDHNIQLGCLMRIADATEAMAKNYVRLQEDADLYKKWWQNEKERRRAEERKVIALKGVITKLKKQLAAKTDPLPSNQ